MKLLFSESQPDYDHYIFPYAIWAFPEPGETPADLFAQGFLPSSKDLDRFYLCRQVRVRLGQFRPSSENRRILRKGQGISCKLIPRDEFDYTPQRREFFKSYADVKFGAGVMPYSRLDLLFGGKIISHLLVFEDEKTGAEVGVVTLFLQPRELAFYYYAFYDLKYFNRSLGMYMMTSAAERFAAEGYEYLYLGSCYSENACYKTQFTGAEFFNGLGWSGNRAELKYLVGRDHPPQHLLENEKYLRNFCKEDLSNLAAASAFRVDARARPRRAAQG